MHLTFELCRRAATTIAVLVLVHGVRPLSAQVPAGQQVPTPDQARQLLQNQPELVEQLRQRLQLSGLTPDQVRSRLRSAGYPENLLDAYLPGSDTSRVTSMAPRTL